MTFSWDAVVMGTIPAVINAVAILFATKYAGRLLTRLENRRSNGDKGKGGGDGKQ